MVLDFSIYCLLGRTRDKGTIHVITGFAYTSVALKGPFNLEIRRRTRLVLFSSPNSISFFDLYLLEDESTHRKL